MPRTRRSDVVPGQEELLHRLRAEPLLWMHDERRAYLRITPDMVGRLFLVVFHYEEDEDATEKRSESVIGAPYTWTARVGMLRELDANVNTNHLECSFWYDTGSVYPDADEWSPGLACTITVPNLSYQLYTVPPSMPHSLPPPPTVPAELDAQLAASRHWLLAPFSQFEAVSAQLDEQHVGLKFVIVHKHYSGWAAYKAKFIGRDMCLRSFPLFLFHYENLGEGPLFITDESQLPDSELPATRIGPSLTYFLYFC
jgi:hypothetical protein